MFQGKQVYPTPAKGLCGWLGCVTGGAVGSVGAVWGCGGWGAVGPVGAEGPW